MCICDQTNDSWSLQFLFSIRAWRGLRFNDKYAAKLEKKLAIKKEREKAKAAEQAKPKTNPFAVILASHQLITTFLIHFDLYRYRHQRSIRLPTLLLSATRSSVLLTPHPLLRHHPRALKNPSLMAVTLTTNPTARNNPSP